MLKIASRCNINCRYCYLYNHRDRSTLTQPKRLSDAVLEMLLDRLIEQGEPVGITLHGGEPLIVGKARFAAIVARIRARLGSLLSGLDVQTNAVLIDDSWAALLVDSGIAVGVSLDGPGDVNDAMRVDHQGQGTYKRVMSGIWALQRAGIEPRVLSVVAPGADGGAVYRHFRAEGLIRFEFLLPDVSHDDREALYGTDPHPVYDFLRPVLDAWLAEDDTNVMIPLFAELFRALMSGTAPRSECFSNAPVRYVVINTDGSIEPLDALKVCADGLVQVGVNVADGPLSALAKRPDLLGAGLRGDHALCDTCKACQWCDTCNGGYLPHRWSASRGFDNPSVWCRDIKMLLGDMAKIVAAMPARSRARQIG